MSNLERKMKRKVMRAMFGKDIAAARAVAVIVGQFMHHHLGMSPRVWHPASIHVCDLLEKRTTKGLVLWVGVPLDPLDPEHSGPDSPSEYGVEVFSFTTDEYTAKEHGEWLVSKRGGTVFDLKLLHRENQLGVAMDPERFKMSRVAGKRL